MHIYFAQVGTGGPIKIGFSRDVRRRLAALQTGHSERLNVLRVYEGSQDDERSLHQRFAAYRENGEWFAPAPEILSAEIGLPAVDIAAALARSSKAKNGYSAEGYKSFIAKHEARMQDPEALARIERGRAYCTSVFRLHTALRRLPDILAISDPPRRRRRELAEALASMEFALSKCPDVMQRIALKAQERNCGGRERDILRFLPAARAALARAETRIRKAA